MEGLEVFGHIIILGFMSPPLQPFPSQRQLRFEDPSTGVPEIYSIYSMMCESYNELFFFNATLRG